MSTPLKEELELAESREKRPLGRLAIALMGIVLTTLGVWTWHFVGLSSIRRKPAGPPPRIAVLPFASSFGTARDQALNRELTQTLIVSLERSCKVVVLPAAFLQSSLDSGAVDPIAAGRELHVNALVFGNLQGAGQSLRIEVRLVSTRDGRQLWASRFAADSRGISGLSARISESIAQHLTALLD